MKRISILFILSLVFVLTLPAQRILFSETIPLQAHIDLQESFSLEVNKQLSFNLNQDVAGNTYQVANYEFYSNSPEVYYQLKLSPGESKNEFAFRSLSTIASDKTHNTTLPFRVSVEADQVVVSNEAYKEVRKQIGIREGSRATETGTIYISFPSLGEGFNLQLFSFGAYEASIAVEVSAD